MSITPAPPPAGQKLAIGEIFSVTFATFWRLKGNLPRVALWPLLLSLITTAVSVIGLDSFVIELAQPIVWAAIYTLLMVAWHRLVLLGSTFESSAPMAWRRDHIVFYAFLLLAYLPTQQLLLIYIRAVIILAPGFIDSAPTEPSQLPVEIVAFHLKVLAGSLIFLVPVYYVFFRLCFVLPAQAVGERYSLADSWRQTRGNGWRLFSGGLLVNIVAVAVLTPAVFILDSIIRMLRPIGAGEVGSVAFMVSALLIGTVYTIAIFIALALNATLMSVAFRKITGWAPANQENDGP